MRTLLLTVSLLVASLAIAPASAEDVDCKEVQRKVVQGVVLYVESDCSAQVDVDVQDCVWGGYWDTTTAGPLTVRVYKCSPPTPMTNSAAIAGPCPSEKQLGVGTLYLEPDCSARLDIKFYECIWGGHWRSYGVEQATVRVYTCDATPPNQRAASPCTNLDGSSWLISFEGEADCSFAVHAIDGQRVCSDDHRRVGAGAGPLTLSADLCTLS